MTNAQLQVKQVEFQGANLLTVQDNENKVWVGIQWVCDGIGLTRDQRQRQTTNMQSDLVLKQGVANLQLPTNGGNQEVLCILIDYLPLWLAKISITPKMQKESPELVEKLIAYQLKAKDVLSAAFLQRQLHQPLQTTNPLLEQAIMSLQQSQQNIIDCSMRQGYVLQDHEQQLEDIYEEVDTLTNSFNEQIAELKEEMIENFEYSCSLARELKTGNKQPTQPLQFAHRPVGKELAHSIIRPLAEARNDITKGYNSTYRLVYKEMGVKG